MSSPNSIRINPDYVLFFKNKNIKLTDAVNASLEIAISGIEKGCVKIYRNDISDFFYTIMERGK